MAGIQSFNCCNESISTLLCFWMISLIYYLLISESDRRGVIIALCIYPLPFYGFPSLSHLLNFPDFPALLECTFLDTLFKEQPKNSAILDCVFPSLSNNRIRILSLISLFSSSFKAFYSFFTCSELR